MSDNIDEHLEELLDQAHALADGPAKLAVLEEAVRIADARQLLDLGFRLRKDLIRTATFTGAKEKALVAFSWRLAQCDRHPDQFPEEDLLWEYKWVVDSVTDYPQISRQQIGDMLADMDRRYERNGRGRRAVYKLRCQTAKAMGLVEEARQAQRLWRAAPVGRGNDCPACERNHQVEYLLFVGKEERALELAEPILRGRLRCAEIPHETYPAMLLPLVRLGRLDEAVQYHLQGYRLVADNAEFLWPAARHLRFLAVTLNLDRAVHLFEKHLPWAVETLALSRRFEFYQSARLLLDLLRETRHDTLAVHLPRALPVAHAERSYRVADLAAFFDEQCRELAERFNARNGNDHFTRRLNEPAEWKQLVTPHPLPRTAP
jgi:hypothetical protein